MKGFMIFERSLILWEQKKMTCNDDVKELKVIIEKKCQQLMFI